MMEREVRTAVVLGASTVAGLGCRDGAPFGRLAAELLGATMVNDLSAPSKQVRDHLETDLPLVQAARPDVAVLHVGGADTLVVPGVGVQRLVERFAPTGWHGVAGLHPRAVYSADPEKAARQTREERAKAVVKRVSVAVTNAGPRVPADLTVAETTGLVHAVAAAAGLTVLVGLHDVDERRFPRMAAPRLVVDAALARLGRDVPGVCYVPLAGRLRRGTDYLGDGMHLSAEGHRRIAELVRDAVAGTVRGSAGRPAHAAVSLPTAGGVR